MFLSFVVDAETSLKSSGRRETGDGLCLLSKRLEHGRFVWPQADSGKVHLTPAQLSMLLEGINWKQPERTWPALSAG
ncbi:IS66 family insertion sequence element accessory protein TnpB [Glaciimonas sp. GG7]